MTPQELLLKAAEEMGRRGKYEGGYEDRETGRVCAYGAMTAAATNGDTANYTMVEEWEQQELIDGAAVLLARSITRSPFHLGPSETFQKVTMFNDDKNTSTEDVVLAMKEAAHG